MNILFIGYDYHEYTRSINDEFIRLGCNSIYHEIQPAYPNFKLARRVNSRVYQSLLDKYHRSIIDAYADNFFDHIIFLQVHQMSHNNLQHLKSKHLNATFTLYNWDSIETHDYRPFLKYFNRSFTFDMQDAKDLGIDFLPLFASRRYQSSNRAKQINNLIYFVGNIVNPQRYIAVRAFEKYCHMNGIEFQSFMSTTVSGMTKMLRSGIFPRHISFQEISSYTMDQMICKSAAVFDFANHSQSGFTMRVMENLCAGKKIITNNPYIKHAPFYSEDRILIYNGFDFSEVKNFLARDLSYLSPNFSEFHIQNFSRRLLGLQ